MSISKKRLRELRAIAIELEELGVSIEVAQRLSFQAQRRMVEHLSDRVFASSAKINTWIKEELKQQ